MIFSENRYLLFRIMLYLVAGNPQHRHRGFYGMEETIERIVGFFRSRSGRAQADSLSAGAGGRWKIVAGGAAEIVDGSPSHLRAEGRRRTQPCVREPPEFVRSGIAGADD